MKVEIVGREMVSGLMASELDSVHVVISSPRRIHIYRGCKGMDSEVCWSISHILGIVTRNSAAPRTPSVRVVAAYRGSLHPDKPPLNQANIATRWREYRHHHLQFHVRPLLTLPFIVCIIPDSGARFFTICICNCVIYLDEETGERGY